MFVDSVNDAKTTRPAKDLERLLDMSVRYQRNVCPIQKENCVVPPIACSSEHEKKDTFPGVNMGRPTALTFPQITKLNRRLTIFVFPVDDALSVVFPYTGLD